MGQAPFCVFEFLFPQLDRVGPLFLRELQGAERFREQLFIGAGRGREVRDARADREVHRGRVLRRGERIGRDLGAEPVRKTECAEPVGLGKYQPELVAADAGDEIDFPRPLQQDGRDVGQRQVAEHMPASRVVVLQVVDVHHHQRHAERISPGSQKLLAQLVVELLPVVQAREWISDQMLSEPVPQIVHIHQHRHVVREQGKSWDVFGAQGVRQGAPHEECALRRAAGPD
jgi:hypothetical protein